MFNELKNTVEKNFLFFTDSFLTENSVVRDNILLKRDHSVRVCSLAMKIGESICLDDEMQFILFCSALLHDCGRFPQFAEYNTFNDAFSVDHGSLGASVIDEIPFLAGVADNMIPFIRSVVEYHNKWKIPSELDEKTKIILSVVRDADKLDIMSLMTEQFRLGEKADPYVLLHLPDTPGCNPALYQALVNRKTITNDMRKNLNDMKLGYMAWVFELNYSCSISHVRESDILKTLMSTLPDNKEFRDVYYLIDEYIRSRC